MTTEVLRLGMDTKGFVTGGKAAQTQLGTLTASLSVAQKAMLGVGVALTALSFAYVSAVKSFIEFDAAMTQSLAIMGEVTVAMEQDMVDAARAVAVELNFTSAQVAESFFFLASAGLDAQQSIAALPAVARFARAGMFDLATATDLATDAQSALGLSSKDALVNLRNMTRVTDVLAAANKSANATIEQFALALTSEAGAALKTFNIDVEEGVAVLAAFADQGVKGQVAGTGLSRILRLMTSAAINNVDAYKDLNIAVFDSHDNIRDLADIIGDLERELLPMSDAARVAALETLGFQARVQGVILPLLGASEKIRELTAVYREAGGTVKEISDNQMQSLQNRIGQIRIRFANWRDEIVEKTVPALELLIESADVLGDALKALLIVAGTTGLVAAFIAIGPPLIAAVGAFLAMVPAVNSVAAAFALLNIAIGPVGWFVAGMTAATALVFAFIRAKKKEKEAIEETNAAAKKDLDERISALSQLTKAELIYQQALLEASIFLTTQALLKENHIRNDDIRIQQLQEMETRLAEVTRLLGEFNEEVVLGGGGGGGGGAAVLTPWQEFLDILKEIREEAEALRRADFKDLIKFGIEIIPPTGGPEAPRMSTEEVVAQLEILNRTLEDTRSVTEKVNDVLLENVEGMVATFRGLLSLGGSLGFLDNDARDAVQGLLELSEGIRLIGQEGRAAQIGGATSIISGLTATIASFLRADEESRQRREQMERDRLDQERENTERFRESVADFAAAVGGTPTSLTAVFDTLNEQLQATIRRAVPREVDPLDVEAERLDLEVILAEKIAEVTARYQEELEVRALLAEGMDDEAARRRLEIEQRQEMFDALEAGWDDVTITLLENVQATEMAAFATREATRATEEAAAAQEKLAAASRTALSFIEDLRVRNLDLDNVREAIAARAVIRARKEIDAAQELLDAGTITQQMFDDLVDILGREMVDALQKFDDAADEAAQREADRIAEVESRKEDAHQREMQRLEDELAAFQRLLLAATDDLEIRQLLIDGMLDEAKLRALEIKQRDELNEFIEKGFSQALIDTLIGVQAAEMAALVESIRQANETAMENERIRTGEAGGADPSTVRGFSAATQGQMSLLIGLEREEVSILRAIEQNTRPFGVTSPDFSGGGGGGGAQVEVNFLGTVNVGDVGALGGQIADSTVEGIDEALGVRQDVAQSHTGVGLTE